MRQGWEQGRNEGLSCRLLWLPAVCHRQHVTWLLAAPAVPVPAAVCALLSALFAPDSGTAAWPAPAAGRTSSSALSRGRQQRQQEGAQQRRQRQHQGGQQRQQTKKHEGPQLMQRCWTPPGWSRSKGWRRRIAGRAGCLPSQVHQASQWHAQPRLTASTHLVVRAEQLQGLVHPQHRARWHRLARAVAQAHRACDGGSGQGGRQVKMLA